MYLSSVRPSVRASVLPSVRPSCKRDRANNSIPIALLSHTDVLQVKISDEFDDDLAVTYISVESRSQSLLLVSAIEPTILF